MLRESESESESGSGSGSGSGFQYTSNESMYELGSDSNRLLEPSGA